MKMSLLFLFAETIHISLFNLLHFSTIQTLSISSRDYLQTNFSTVKSVFTNLFFYFWRTFIPACFPGLHFDYSSWVFRDISSNVWLIFYYLINISITFHSLDMQSQRNAVSSVKFRSYKRIQSIRIGNIAFSWNIYGCFSSG